MSIKSASLMLVIGDRQTSETGVVTWEGDVKSKHIVITPFDCRNTAAIDELHTQLDEAIAKIIKETE